MNVDYNKHIFPFNTTEEESGMKVTELHKIGAYSKVDRDPRGRTITVAYLALVSSPIPVTGQDDATKAEWFPIEALPPLGFDHVYLNYFTS